MRKFFITGFAAMAVFLLTFCEKKQATEENKGKTAKSSEELLTEYKQLSDSLNLYWEEMMRSDDQKIEDIKRLLLEVTYCNRYNKIAHDSISKMAEALKGKRYDMKSMADSDKIDQYDAATDSLIRAAFELTQNTTELSKHDIVPKLIEDITEADMTIWKYRKNYDIQAVRLNEFLEDNKDMLKTMDSSLGSFSKKPLFQILP